jgi:ABC-type nitrate/sulfonate/bicarbonate transport system substrate-binding protein
MFAARMVHPIMSTGAGQTAIDNRGKRTMGQVFGCRMLAAAVIVAFGTVLGGGATTAQAQSPPQAGQKAKIVVALTGITSSIWPTLIAETKGYFAEFGVEPEFVNTGSSAKSIQQVAAGAAHMGSSSLMDTARAIDAGADVVVVANGLDISMHGLIAAKNVKAVSQLKGKRVIVGGTKDITNVWWAAMARDQGLNPESDVQTIYSGSTANRFAALVSGGVEAAVLAPPATFKAIEDGYVDLGAVAAYLKDVPYLVFHAGKRWAASNPAAVVGFIKAHNKAIDFLNNPKNREEASKILAEKTQIEMDMALKNYDLIVNIKGFAAGSGVSDEGVKKALGILKADGDIASADVPPNRIFDPTFVQRAKN